MKNSKIKRTLALVMVFSLCLSLFSAVQVNADIYPGNVNFSRIVATEGMVLLENNGALPLNESDTVTLLGNRHMYNKSMMTGFQKGGGGSGDVYGAEVKDILTGMKGKAEQGKVGLYTGLSDKYKTHLALNKLIPNELALTDEDISLAKENSNTAIVTIGRWTSELFDHKDEKGDYYLSDKERENLRKICKAGFDKVVVILNIGSVMDTSWIKDYPEIDAVLLAWLPGTEGGLAISDILVGDVNPSGKLASTFAKSYRDYPTYGTYFESKDYVNYTEDIFLGYRYFETFDPTYNKVNYPFGYGLSYTSFEVNNISVDQSGTDINVQVDVTNVGEVAGKEIVQVYFSAPQGLLGKPGKELAGFAKTGLLQPGETETLFVSYPIDEMSSYDDTGKVQKSAYLLEAGDYAVYVGNSIRDAGNRGVQFVHNEAAMRVVEQLSEKIKPVDLPRRLLANGSYEMLDGRLEELPEQVRSYKIEAENYVDAHWSVKPETFTVNEDSGIALARMNDLLNTYAVYQLNVQQAGDYQLVFKVANGHWDISDMVEIYVNDVKQENVRVDVPQTGKGILRGEWHNYIETEPVSIYLPAGECSLKLKSKNNGFANIDYFTLTQPENVSVETEADSADNYRNTEEATAEQGHLNLIDVYHDRSLMQAFVNQFSVLQLASLLGGKLPKLPGGGTGGMGGMEKYGVPEVQTADGPAGIRLSTGGTAWPCATLQACTWDTGLVSQIGTLAGKEAVLNNVDIWLAPGMNIQRDPMCGRNFEYYSEDPFLTGQMAIALTQSVQREGVMITIKHFIANNKEGNRNSSDSRISERAIREIYLKGFEDTVKAARPRCVMTSYNLVNGYETSANKELLTDILRGEWGFDGMVMTDWFNQSSHTQEIYAGNDIKMPFGSAVELAISVDKNLLSRQDLERSAKRLFDIIMDTPLFRKSNGLPLYTQ